MGGKRRAKIYEKWYAQKYEQKVAKVNGKEKKMFKRFADVVVDCERQGKRYAVSLTPLGVTTLHGAIVLVLKHPEIKTKSANVIPILMSIRKQLLACMENMGFTKEEMQYLDTKDVE